MITTTNLNEARKQILKLRKEGEQVIVKSQSNEFNRKILENKDVDMIIGLELHGKREGLKQRDSGLNEILCKLAKKNDIKIGIDLEKISKLDKIEKAKTLARVRQNIKLCKRTNTNLVITNNNKQDVTSFFLSLKGSTKQAKKAFNFE